MEIIKYLCPIVLFIFSVLAIFFAFIILCSEERKDTENKLLVAFCLSSSIWSIGFGALILQTNPQWAYYCRVFGMIGTIMYLIIGQMLISYLSGINGNWAKFFNYFASTGILIYFLTVERSQTIYHLDVGGMTYSFKPGIASTIYTAYSLILAVLMFTISLYMCFSNVKRIRFFGKIFMMTVAAMLIGTVLDTVLPLLGFTAIPGSTLMQFWGMVVVYMAIRANNRSKINITNMSEFIYYSLSMPVLIYNSGKQLQIANEAAAKFLDINQNQIPQNNYHINSFFKLEDSILDFDDISKTIDSTCIQNQIPCNLAISKIQDRYNDIIGYIIIVTDLSERVKTLQHLEAAKQEAEAANHSKTAFLANMSHEIRTPMNAILGFTELILKKNIADSVHEYASDIKTSCLNLLAVINDILDISKLDSGKAELSCDNYNSAFLFQEVFHIIDIQAQKKGLCFEMNIDSGIPNILYGDMTRIRGILINLLNNAVKYTEKGSVIFHVHLLETNNNIATLEYVISDTGIGIKESSMEHLFDTFARFDSKRNMNIEGTGLGLSIVNGYVNLMNGTIKVDSTYGQGSTFTLTLNQKIIDASPINLNKTAIKESNSLNTKEINITNTHVLVTDDNLLNLKVIRNTLEYYGLTVDTAASGSEAIQLCSKTSYDIVFMDQMMPYMDGIETMKQIRLLSSHYAPASSGKIIALTANAIIGVRNELLETGFDEYLSKPIQFSELERILKQFIPKHKFTAQKENRAETSASLEDLLPQVDIAAGLSHCYGDKNFYIEILHILYEDAPKQLDTLCTLFDKKDYSKFIIQMHNLKTQLLNIGYNLLAEDARALEYAGRENRLDYIKKYLNPFIEDYNKLTKQLENVFSAFPSQK